MAFHPIDLDSFPRKEHYLSFIGNNQCSYSMTVNVDITVLGGQKLYPAMIPSVDKDTQGFRGQIAWHSCVVLI